MSLSVGIVGLPNAGKSTLFNALLKKQVADTANYPFCTIEPNKGIVEVPDGRLPVLAKIVKTSKIVPAAVEFVDIAGLVKGASQGEGLGNKFLANIREVTAIVEVVRFFEDENVVHVAHRIDPEDDVEIINSELILADLQTLEKQKEPRGKVEKEARWQWEAVVKLREEMNRGKLASEVALTEEQREAARIFCLLTAKPIFYVANLDEAQLVEREAKLAKFKYEPVIGLSAKTEAELAALPEEDQRAYLAEYGLTESGLDRLIKLAYDKLGLISFLTAGEIEARAWTIKAGMTAREGSGVIHTDFMQKFIKAEVVSFEDFVEYGGWENARAAGKVRSEGKDYCLTDGEVVEFKIGR